jgi:hypothetical protein
MRDEKAGAVDALHHRMGILAGPVPRLAKETALRPVAGNWEANSCLFGERI